MFSSASHLLGNAAEVLMNVVHAAFLQHLTGMGLSEAVNPHTVHLIHLTLHETTTGLSNGHHVQQIGCCQQGLGQIKLSSARAFMPSGGGEEEKSGGFTCTFALEM